LGVRVRAGIGRGIQMSLVGLILAVMFGGIVVVSLAAGWLLIWLPSEFVALMGRDQLTWAAFTRDFSGALLDVIRRVSGVGYAIFDLGRLFAA